MSGAQSALAITEAASLGVTHYLTQFLPWPFTDSTNPHFGALAQLHFVDLVNSPRKGGPTRTLTIRETRNVTLLLCSG